MASRDKKQQETQSVTGRQLASGVEKVAVEESDISFEALFLHGTRLLKGGKIREAETMLEEAHRLNPEHVDASLNLSGAYILDKKFAKAVAILEPLRDLAPETAEIWINLGAAYLGNPVLANNDQQQKAIEAFERALAINPEAHSVAYNLGLIYRDRRETDNAIYWFQEAIKHNASDQDARNMLAKLEE